MNWKVWLLSFCLSVVLPLAAQAQASVPKEASQSSDKTQSVVVPAKVTALLRPILDEKQRVPSTSRRDEWRLMPDLPKSAAIGISDPLTDLARLGPGEFFF
jgi:hypothetical protein